MTKKEKEIEKQYKKEIEDLEYRINRLEQLYVEFGEDIRKAEIGRSNCLERIIELRNELKVKQTLYQDIKVTKEFLERHEQ